MPTSSSLRGRVPGQAAMSALVETQLRLPRRHVIARIFGRSPLTASTRSLYRAALGELVVGDALDHLGREWDVLHVVPLEAEAALIDHLVIGPPGVFTLMTENYPGQEVRVAEGVLLVAGHQFDDILLARRLADSAAELLTAAAGRIVSVQPVIVVVSPTRLVLREEPSEVTVVASRHLLRWLTMLERTIPGPEVAFVSDIAERDRTWRTSPGPLQDSQQLHREFAIVREEVRRARLARILWGAGLLAAVCVAGWIAVAVALQP